MGGLQSHNISSVLMHFRGCSGEPNKTAGAYHSAHTTDIQHTIDLLHNRFPLRSLIAVGYSLGGNALLKYLATTPDNPLRLAVAVCPPLVLAEGADRINKGFSRVYQATLIKKLRVAMQAKREAYPHLQLQTYDFNKHTNFIDWDHHITAPLHGFASGEDYYARASTFSDLLKIDTPAHIIFSQHDPFFTEKCIPTCNAQLSSNVEFEVVKGAGHVGFISGNIPLMGKDWLRHRVVQLVTSAVDHQRPVRN